MAHPQETRTHTNLGPTQRRTPAAPCGKHQTSHMRPDVHRHSQRLRTGHPVVPRDDGPPAATKRIVGLPTSSVAPEVFFGDHTMASSPSPCHCGNDASQQADTSARNLPGAQTSVQSPAKKARKAGSDVLSESAL